MKYLYRFLTIIMIILFSTQWSSAQKKQQTNRVRNVIWTTPVKKNTTINGIAFGILDAHPWMGATRLNINGVNCEIAPLTIAGGFIMIGIFLAPYGYNDDNTLLKSKNAFPVRFKEIHTKISGVSISAGGLIREKDLSGVALNGVMSTCNKVVGLQVTGLINLQYEFKGVMIAGFKNKATKGKGVQIGLFNTCKGGQVVQIGLINIIGRRVLPFINLQLGKRHN